MAANRWQKEIKSNTEPKSLALRNKVSLRHGTGFLRLAFVMLLLATVPCSPFPIYFPVVFQDTLPGNPT